MFILHSAQNGALNPFKYLSCILLLWCLEFKYRFPCGLTFLMCCCDLLICLYLSLPREQTSMTNRSGKLRVAVVGAGAAGLCAAHHILSRAESFEPPMVFEQSARVGGTWYYEERVGTSDDGRPIHGSMYRDLRWRITLQHVFTERFMGDLNTLIWFSMKVYVIT